jgi:DNA-binding response OmpR family regulator
MPALRVLVIEDNLDLAANLLDYLGASGHIPDCATDGVEGLRMASGNEYDVILLDLTLPRLDGLALCCALREAGCPTPVLMLTARDSLEDKIAGLESGADDYLVKPFSMREVEARIRVLARRGQPAALQRTLRVGDLAFDTEALKVTRAGRAIALPRIPLRLLERLMRASPRVVPRAELERAVWGDDPPDSDALRAHLHVLRTAIDRDAPRPLLHTMRGLGWKLAEERSDAS